MVKPYIVYILSQKTAGTLPMRPAPVILCAAIAVLSIVRPSDGKVFATQMGSRIVETQYGRLRGVLVTLPNRNLPQVEAFFGLQYASILQGELRFMPPTSPMEKWDGIRVALKFRPVCPQKLPDIADMKKKMPTGRVDHFERVLPFLERQAEECLNLNVYVPIRDRNDTDNHLLPVMLFIHGETYEMGTGNAYDGSVLASFGQVVVVTMNFRLGVLGFMSTGDSNAPGNYALLDQVAALHWIKENIEVFGGNPNEVTLLGQGYGAAMVNLLLISPVTKGKNLFKGAIIQSGSALSSWAVVDDPLRYTRELAEKVNCSQYWGQNAQLLYCFKQKPYEDLINVDIKAPKYFSPFGPVIDKRSVLPTDVRSLMEKSRSVFGDTNLLLGIMRNEGFLYFNQPEIDEGVSEHKMQKMIRTYVRNMYQYHRQKIYEILLHHYSDWERPNDPAIVRDNLMDLIGDGQFIAPMIELTQFHAEYAADTFMYSFSYPSRLDTYPRWAGGVHGDDMTYVFGAPLTDGIEPFTSTFTRSEKMLTEAVMRYWSNFMKSGDPNKPLPQESLHGGRVKNRFSELVWPTFDNDGQEYLRIGMRPVIRHHYRGTKMALWMDLIPKLHKSDDLSPRYHLLESYDNKTTFEEEGTKPLNLKDLLPHPPLPPNSPPPRSTTPTAVPSTTPVVTTTTPLPSTTPRPRQTTTTRKPNLRTRRTTTISPPTTTAGPMAGGLSSKDTTLSLSVTIAVGCSLLFLNILIFAGVYYQKDRMRMEMKMRKRELEKEQEAHQGADSDHMKSSTGPETDTNSSSMATPPIPPSISRHQIQPQVTTLPHANKGPIPVMPPQAPYHTTPSRRSPRHLRHMDHTHVLDDGMLKHSSSADSGTDVNNHHHHGNPSTVV